MAVTNVLIAGVGGQGVILASEILALAALAHGRDVKQGEFHGVAQRGGAVFSHVRFGDRVRSPMARRGAVDFLVALEELEALRYAHFTKPGGTILVNELRVEPARIGDDRPYPENTIAFLSGRGFDTVPIEATAKAIELGNYRAANVIMLGALAAYLDIPGTVWQHTLTERIPAKLLALNLEAFAAGRALVPGAIRALQQSENQPCARPCTAGLYGSPEASPIGSSAGPIRSRCDRADRPTRRSR